MARKRIIPLPAVTPVVSVFFLSLVFALLAPGAEAAPSPQAGLSIEGQVQYPTHLTVDALKNIPETDVSVSHVTGHGQETATYQGALLWRLLSDAVLINGQGKGALLRHSIVVTGRDGYAVVLSVGELAPDFEGKSVIIAYSKDGRPIPTDEGLKLIVPGDKHGGRAVRDVTNIEVR